MRRRRLKELRCENAAPFLGPQSEEHKVRRPFFHSAWGYGSMKQWSQVPVQRRHLYDLHVVAALFFAADLCRYSLSLYVCMLPRSLFEEQSGGLLVLAWGTCCGFSLSHGFLCIPAGLACVASRRLLWSVLLVFLREKLLWC